MNQLPSTRLRVDLAYDGGQFSGWARQPGSRTVQGELEAALATVFSRYGEPPKLSVAGRTDAGVHAIGQVAHFDLSPEQFWSLLPNRAGTQDRPAKPDPGALRPRLNGIAGRRGDLRVHSVSLAPTGFDARFSAIWRRYEYRVADADSPQNPLLRGHTLWHPARLDVAAMNRAAQAVVGLNDFASYCIPREVATTVRTLQHFSWQRAADGVLVASLQADAFCHSMVRALVGASIAVGEGKLAEQRLRDLLDARERTSAFRVVSAKGLVLVEVGYPDDAGLAARADQTRARRAPLVDLGGVNGLL